MLIHAKNFVLSFITLAVVICLLELAAGKTAPEFRVTVDTKNFKEIRIPLKLWKKIIGRDYGLSEKTVSNPMTKQNAPLNGTMVHEIVLNIVVPEDEIDSEESSDQIIKPAVEEEVLIEPAVDMVGEEVAEAVQPAVEAIDAVAPLTPQDQAAAIASDISDGSVLVQTTRFPCSCDKGICECCARMFQQKGCANLKFLPEEFAFEMKMTMNGNILAKRKLPVNDPPPFCFNPRRAPFLELCAQLTDISIKKENVHACVDLEASVGGLDLFSWNYDCVKFGRQGFFAGQKKPSSSSGGFDFFGLFGGGGSDDDEGGILDGILPGGDDDDDDDEDDDDY